MTAEIRRGIFERVLARLDARGARFERDPGFLVHVEEWIDGKIEIQELRARYMAFARSAPRRNLPEPEIHEDDDI